MSEVQAGPKGRLCSIAARGYGEDPGGTAPTLDLCLLIELPKPWHSEITESNGFPPGVSESLARAANTGRSVKLLGLEPDADYSVEGHVRVILYSRPDGPFTTYDKSEFAVPGDDVAPLVDALLDGPREVGTLERYRQETSGVRDILVCTHGTHDSCCGTFGYPVYHALRHDHVPRSAGDLRVWQVSHIGGHRFAPNLLDMPEGRNWVRVGVDSLENLVHRRGEVSDLRGYYRGSIGLRGPHEQLVEREAFMREGWAWTDFPITVQVQPPDDEGGQTEVHLDFVDPRSGMSGAYKATVTHTGKVAKANCLAEPEEIDQYVTSGLTRVG